MPPFLANVNPSYNYDILRAEFLLEENKKARSGLVAWLKYGINVYNVLVMNSFY